MSETNPHPFTQARRDLLTIFQAGLDRVRGREAVAQHLRGATQEPTAVIAIGKAAESMCIGAQDELGANLVAGLIITKYDHGDPGRWAGTNVRLIESAHPVPDNNCLAAGRALLDFIAAQPQDRPLLFLISGGASSLVEVLRPGLTLDDLRQVNDWLLGSGLAIDQMNWVRQRLSCIKAGGLLSYVADRPCRLLLISDVPGDDPAVIGSGLMVPARPGVAGPELPCWLVDKLVDLVPPQNSAVPEPELVACLADALDAAEQKAVELGYVVSRHPEFLDGDAAEVAAALVQGMADATPGLHLWGGETTVRLPESPGRGGRNQQLALAAAVAMHGRGDMLLLSGGTDGTDGPTEDAGGIVDGNTLTRVDSDAEDAGRYLAHADAGSFLEMSGDLINTGPTGTNVMDLVIGLKL